MPHRSFIPFAFVFVVSFAAGCALSVGPGGNHGDAAGSVDGGQFADGFGPRPEADTNCHFPDGRICPLGQSCPADDGCNQCSCSTGGVLACTERDCVRTCRTSADCLRGQECSGPAGCDVQWTCGEARACLTVE